MIEVFEGRLGGGKSYHAVKRAFDWLCEGGTVCTNISLNWSAVCDLAKRRRGLLLESSALHRLTNAELPNFHRRTPGGTPDCPVLVIIDEAQLVWNSRDYRKTDETQREMLSFLTQSRKACTDIIFITQDARNIDSQFLRLIQYVWRFRDMKRFKILGIPWPFNQFLSACFDYDGSTLLKKKLEAKDLAIFDLYDTNELLEGFQRSGVAAKRDLKKVKKRRPMFKILLVLFVVLLFLVPKMLGWVFSAVAPSASDPGPEFDPVEPAPARSVALPEQPIRALPGAQDALVWAGHYYVTLEPYRGHGRYRGPAVPSGRVGLPYLATSVETYELNENCRLGRVVQVVGRRAKVRMLDGKYCIIETYNDAAERWAELHRRAAEQAPSWSAPTDFDLGG